MADQIDPIISQTAAAVGPSNNFNPHQSARFVIAGLNLTCHLALFCCKCNNLLFSTPHSCLYGDLGPLLFITLSTLI